MSAGLGGIKGLYHGRETYPNLYCLILAPAASGKSVMNYARMLGEAYEASLQKKYREEKKEYNRALKAGKEDPKAPSRELFFIPANSSSSRVIQHLKEGQGSGLICETEADTLGNVLKQDWGGYSDILRKAYSGEAISQSRQTEDAYIHMAKTRLSVLMTGTLNQLFQLIPSAENGLFSRFLFYTYQLPPVWQDVSPEAQNVNLTAYFKETSKEVKQMIEYWKEVDLKFELTKAQWVKLNKTFSKILLKQVAIYGSGADAIVKRYGNALFRIAMILTACRDYEKEERETRLICTDTDFEIATELVKVYLEHALLILERLPREEKVRRNKLPNHKRLFFEALPKSFKRKEAIALGLKYEMKPRTVDRLLKELKGVSINDLGGGHYEKV